MSLQALIHGTLQTLIDVFKTTHKSTEQNNKISTGVISSLLNWAFDKIMYEYVVHIIRIIFKNKFSVVDTVILNV